MSSIEHYTNVARNFGLNLDKLLVFEYHDIPRRIGWSMHPYDDDELVMIGFEKDKKEFIAYFLNERLMRPFEGDELRIGHVVHKCNEYCFKVGLV